MKKIALCKASIGHSEIEEVEKVLKSGWLTHGPKNTEFERMFCDYLSLDYAVSMNSCTSALFIALTANNIRGEVILPSFTFVASANAVAAAGAIPVFADIDEETYTICPDSVERLISNRTEAIMAVHYAGQCCDMSSLARIATKYNLVLIEDSAETIGGRHKGEKCGSWGIGCFSFFPTKNITTGEGGMLTTNDKQLAEKARALVGHGIIKQPVNKNANEWRREAHHFGYNFRLSNVLAALGVEQMKKIDKLNMQRRNKSRRLSELLGGSDKIIIPREREDNFHVYQMYTIRVSGRVRDKVVQGLRKAGIAASVHFDPPVHRQKIFSGFRRDNLTVTEKVSETIITLPMYPDITEHDLECVASCLKNLLRRGFYE